MPMYEFMCRGCGHRFETLVLKDTTPSCPACTSQDLDRLVSVPALKSESTHAQAMKAAKQRDKKQASENARAQREYELHHND